MIIIKTMKRDMIASCVAFYMEEAKDDQDQTIIFGMIATTLVPIEIGRYKKETAERVIELIFRTFGVNSLFEMPVMESENNEH